MAELYRAQWNHIDEDVMSRVSSAVSTWLREKFHKDFPFDGSTYSSSFTARGTECTVSLDVVDEEAPSSHTAAFRLTETKQTGEFWATDIVAVYNPDQKQADYYCSVSTEQVDHHAEIAIAAPRVAVALLSGATSKNWPLDPQSLKLDAEVADHFATVLASSDRGLPFVVLRPGDESENARSEAISTADRIAKSLAGLCSVQVLNSELVAALSPRFTSDGYFLPAGHIRVFHPSATGRDLATRANPMRRLRSAEAIVGWVRAQVAPRSVVRQPQSTIAQYLRSDRALTAISGGETHGSVERVNALENANKRLNNAIVELEHDNENLLVAAEEYQLEYGVLNEEFGQVRAHMAKTTRDLRAMETALKCALAIYPDLDAMLHERGLHPWPQHVESTKTPDDVATIASAMDPGSSTDCFEYSRELLTEWLSIPESAGQELNVLDDSPNASVWAAKAWRAFVALAAYAEAKKWDPEGVTGFWEWCESGAPLHWQASQKLLAMKESDGTMNNRKFAGSRAFPTEEGSTMVMEAHIKISAGGNDTIPRLYFSYDETLGKVRVGFFGPHRCVPNPSGS